MRLQQALYRSPSDPTKYTTWTLYDAHSSGTPVDERGEDMELLGILLHTHPEDNVILYHRAEDNKLCAYHGMTGLAELVWK